MSRRSILTLIYGNAFLVGGVLMGFEMLGSRYLFPYFGGGIGTWGGLISMVLCPIAVGYFTCRPIVDRPTTLRIVAAAIIMAAVYLAIIPSMADATMSWILNV